MLLLYHDAYPTIELSQAAADKIEWVPLMPSKD